MFHHSRCTRTLSNLPIVKSLRYELSNKFCNKSDDPPKVAEDTSVSKLLEDAATFTEMSNAEWATTPYPATAAPVLEDEKPEVPKMNPKDTSILLFPGQGIVKVGDVKEYLRFPRVQELFSIASDILGYNLLQMCMKGPQSILDRTEFNQPATVVTSLAAIEKLKEERPRAIDSCVGVAGYSVGELTALIFSGAMPYEEGLRLVGIRAAAMQSAAEMSPQGMLSSYCTPQAKPSKICEEAQKWALDMGATTPVCKVAIYLHTQGKIFGGSKEALDYIQQNSRNLKLRKVQKLPVSGAFHTILMEPALKSFIKALNETPLDEPNAYVYSNYSANTYSPSEKKIENC